MEVPRISSGSSSKRARAITTATTDDNTNAKGSNFSHCLVDGCNADLSSCRDYHRRHKVCETHSKTPKVTISGREQRFCQQCSRFHSLVEFDEWKRSCRKRLDGHNRRRRKPPPPPRNSSSLLSFGGGSPPKMLQAPSNDHDMLLFYNQQQQLVDNNRSESSSLLMLQSSESGHIQMNMSDHGALSLLSSPATASSALPHLTTTHHPQNNFYDYTPSTQQYCVSDVSAPDLFQHGSPTTTANGSHQTHTFVWE